MGGIAGPLRRIVARHGVCEALWVPLSPDIELADLDGNHWANWFDLVVPRQQHGAQWALITVDGDQVIHALKTPGGHLKAEEVPFSGTDTRALKQLRRDLGVGLVGVIEHRALAEILRAVESELSLDDDYVEQCLTIVRAFKRAALDRLAFEPPILDMLPTPPKRAVQRTFDLLFANRTSFVMYVFDDRSSELYASIISTKTDGVIDFATTHLALESTVPANQLARTWRSQYRRILKVVGDRYERPCLGVFCTKQALERLLVGPTDQLTQEITKRNIILDPAPTWMLGLLGGAAVASVAQKSAKALAGLLPVGARKLATDLAGSANARLRSSQANPFRLLGFDPIELFFQLRRLYR